jgi:hypothetical protein
VQAVRAALDQREPHLRVLGAEVAQQPRHRLPAQRGLGDTEQLRGAGEMFLAGGTGTGIGTACA